MINPTDKLRKTTRKVFVAVKLSNSEEYKGYIHLGYCERVQDVLNDERKFIPLEVVPSSGSSEEVVMMGKQYIITMKEAKEQERKVLAPAPASAKSASVVNDEPELVPMH